MRDSIIYMLFLFIFFINVSTLNPQEKKIVDEFEMSLEDLLKVNVITAAKSPQQIGDIPASSVLPAFGLMEDDSTGLKF